MAMKITTSTLIIDEFDALSIGPEHILLLERIKEFKSISKAAKSIPISYGKALNISNRLENCLG
jgi:molybdate transport repressor ModE-like protein